MHEQLLKTNLFKYSYARALVRFEKFLYYKNLAIKVTLNW